MCVIVPGCVFLQTLLRRRDSLARLTCRDSGLSHYVTLHCHAFRRALQLPVWFRNRHAQSLLGLWANEPGVQFNRYVPGHAPAVWNRALFSVALPPQRPYGLLGTGSPGRPPRLSQWKAGRSVHSCVFCR